MSGAEFIAPQQSITLIETGRWLLAESLAAVGHGELVARRDESVVPLPQTLHVVG